MIETKETLEERVREEIDTSEIISRLKREQKEFRERYRDFGKRAGLEWSRMAHYADLLHALQHKSRFDLTKDDRLGPYFIGLFETDPLLAQDSNIHAAERIEIRKRFTIGWQESVQQFWEQIQEQLSRSPEPQTERAK